MMMRTLAMVRMMMMMMKMVRRMMTNLASEASLRETVLSSAEKFSAERSLATWKAADDYDDHDDAADEDHDVPVVRMCLGSHPQNLQFNFPLFSVDGFPECCTSS